jgi:hypothetical protein
MYASKDKVRVMIVLADFRIEGDMHVLVGSRLTDALNSKAKDFLAVTAARVRRVDDDAVLYEPEYAAVNRDAIQALFPLEEGW